MAHYSGVNANALINSINNCRNKLNKSIVNELLNDARSMPWDGAEAKDNLVNAINQIKDKNSKLISQLDKALRIAQNIKKYKSVKENLDDLKRNLSNLQYRYNRDPNGPSAQYLKWEINRLQRNIFSLNREFKSLRNSLSSAGYPPS